MKLQQSENQEVNKKDIKTNMMKFNFNTLINRGKSRLLLGGSLAVFAAIYGFTHYQTPKLPPGDKNNAGLVLPDGFEALPRQL